MRPSPPRLAAPLEEGGAGLCSTAVPYANKRSRKGEYLCFCASIAPKTWTGCSTSFTGPSTAAVPGTTPRPSWTPGRPKTRTAPAGRRPSPSTTAWWWKGRGGLAAFGDLDGSYLDRLYVHPDCRGQGLAALLVDALEARALQGGVKVLRTDASITALPFFLARGYRVVREQQVKRGEQTLTNYALEREL